MIPSIIIPYRDRPEHLEASLESIRAYTEAEVVVVDDDSRSLEGAAIALRWRAWYASLPVRPGPAQPFRASQCRNLGAAVARGDLLVFSDVDVLHAQGAVDRLVELAQVADGEILLPLVRFASGPEMGAPATVSRPWIYGKLGAGQSTTSRDWLAAWSTFMAVPRSVYNAVGGFDQAFEGWAPEDMDFSYRAARIGVQFCFTRGASGLHAWHPDQPEKEKTGAFGHYLFQKKHGFPLPSIVCEPEGEPIDLRR